MFDLTVKNILNNIWPMILIITLILSTLRIAEVIKYKEKIKFYDEMMKLGFVLYIMTLFYVVTFQDVSWSTSNLIPFKEIFRYQLFSSSFFKNVIGNLFMFMPYGFFISYFLKIEKKWLPIIYSLIVSFTIEITQLIIGRVFDVDDILLNVLGGFLGYLIYKCIHNFKQKLNTKHNYVYNIITTLVIGLIVVYICHILEVI